MKGAPVYLCALLAATLFGLPSKSEEIKQVKQKSPYAEWSVGIGVGFGFYFLGLTALTITDMTPSGRVMVERRMGDKFAILFLGSTVWVTPFLKGTFPESKAARVGEQVGLT